MASLMIQDAFEPYYAGRDDAADARAKPRQPPKKRSERASESEIVLPCEAPAARRRGPARPPRDRALRAALPSRFDIFLRRLALGERKDSPRPNLVGDKHGAGRDQGDAGPVGRAKAHAQENGEHRRRARRLA